MIVTMSGRSRSVELESDLVLNQRLLQSVGGLMDETLGVGQDISNYCNDDDELKKATQDIMLSFVNMVEDLKQITTALNHVKNISPVCQTDSDAESGQEENLTAAFTQKLDELKGNSSGDERRLVNHPKYTELTSLFIDRGTVEEQLVSLRAALMGTEEESQGDLAMTEADINTRCPYTGCVMQDPVRNKLCGHVYDRVGILTYIKQKKSKAKCPVGGCGNAEPIHESHLEDHRDMKRYITLLSQSQGS